MITSNSSKYLDGKQCLSLWAELGSLGKVQKYFAANGIVNPTTHLPPTRMSISYSAWKWALENRQNLEYAKKNYFEPLMFNAGQVWDEDQWGIWFVKHAHTSYVPKQYQLFLNRFPEFQKYDKMIYGQE